MSITHIKNSILQFANRSTKIPCASVLSSLTQEQKQLIREIFNKTTEINEREIKTLAYKLYPITHLVKDLYPEIQKKFEDLLPMDTDQDIGRYVELLDIIAPKDKPKRLASKINAHKVPLQRFSFIDQIKQADFFNHLTYLNLINRPFDFQILEKCQNADTLFINYRQLHELTSISSLKNLTSLKLIDCEYLRDSELKALSPLTKLTSLSLIDCDELTDKGIKYLSCFKELKFLDLSGSNIWYGSKYLSSLKKLTHLNLANSECLDNKALQHLTCLSKLTSLNLFRCYELTEECLDHLVKLPLTSLDLWQCHSGAYLKELCLLTELTHLTIAFSNAEELKPLRYLNKLTSLHITEWPNLKNEALQHLLELPLTSLTIGCPLSDDGLKQLGLLTKLTHLNLQNCENLTDKGLENLSLLKQLTSLTLKQFPQLTKQCLDHLVKLPLTSLILQECHLDVYIKKLGLLMELTHLTIAYCDFAGTDGLAPFKSLRKLTSLHIIYCQNLKTEDLQYILELPLTSLTLGHALSDDDLKQLCLLTGLTDLNLQNCENLTDKGARHLSSLKQLISLNLKNHPRLTNSTLLTLPLLNTSSEVKKY